MYAAPHAIRVERLHQTLKNHILLKNYYLPGDLEARIYTFVDHYNHRRYHESSDNITPADVASPADKPSCWNEKGSNEPQPKIPACNTN
jgi:hypothetical protein